MANYPRILQPGRNCWRIRRADRVAFLIDGDAYFSALHQTLSDAQKQILISSWDIYSEMRIGALQGDKRTLAETLDNQLHQHRHLHVYILNWDFSRLLDMGREWLPIYKFGWKTHPRLEFKLDSEHPTGASHHQKFVVLDDQLAFSGGLDITRGRWDTPQHLPHDTRRKKIDGSVGRPYHDVQIVVSGDAATALGDLFRERWRRATDQKLNPIGDDRSKLWPQDIAAELEQVDIAISRTEPGYNENQAVREVEQLYLDAIAGARNYIYIENQFFTSPVINQALTRRLLEVDGPEIVLNLPLETEGWLSQKSLDIIRVQLLHDLRQADQHNRLAVYYPYKKDLETTPINLHAKVMFVDDRFVRVGSSNLNNRSMGLDSECDIAIESDTDEHNIGHGIRHFCNRLLAEHFAVTPYEADTARNESPTLIDAIESLREKDARRSLMPLERVLPEYEDGILTDTQLVDPEEPINPEGLLYHFLPEQATPPAAKRIIGWLTTVILLVVVAGLWRFTALGEWLEIDKIINTIETLRSHSLSIPLIIGGFILAAMVMVPVTMLVIACVIVFGPGWGAVYALTGAVISAVLTYLLGNLMGRDAIKGLAGGRINHISQKLARHSIITVTFVRIVPVAPFTVINLVAGASHISLRDFTLGTLLGLVPGITGVALLTNRIQATLRTPDLPTILLLLLVITIMLLIGYAATRFMRRRSSDL